MHYMGYEPIKDASGKVIGAYSVGVERFTGPLLCARQPALGVALVLRPGGSFSTSHGFFGYGDLDATIEQFAAEGFTHIECYARAAA